MSAWMAYAHCATLTLKQTAPDRYLVTAVESTEGEYSYLTSRNAGGAVVGLVDADGMPSSWCGRNGTASYINCDRPSWPNYGNGPQCESAGYAVGVLQRLVGVTLYSKPSPAGWSYRCTRKNAGKMYYVQGQFNTTPPPPIPVACTSMDTTLTLRGSVGERVKETASWSIWCTKRVSLRLSIAQDGVVQTTGGGEVQLTFTENGQATLNITDTSPTILIDGELTKSPTTAGTYQGSAVLRIQVL